MTTEARTTVHRECDVCGKGVTVNLASDTLKMADGIRVEITSPSVLCAPCFEKAVKAWLASFDRKLVSALRKAKAATEQRYMVPPGQDPRFQP